MSKGKIAGYALLAYFLYREWKKGGAAAFSGPNGVKLRIDPKLATRAALKYAPLSQEIREAATSAVEGFLEGAKGKKHGH